jgi:hypothetical protein
VKLLLADAEHAIVQPADFAVVREHGDRVLSELGGQISPRRKDSTTAM